MLDNMISENNTDPSHYINDPIHKYLIHNIHVLWYIAALGITAGIAFFLRTWGENDDKLFTVNKLFFWEPSFLARFRWITNADLIIDAADEKAQGRAYRLCRGDVDQIILPTSMIPELNGLGLDVLNSRESHAFGLLGHLTGMDVVRHTSFHVRVLLSHISPALPDLFALTGARISASIKGEFPQIDEWTAMKPHKAIVRSIGEAIALALFGAEMTEGNPELVHLTHEHTNNGKSFILYTLNCSPTIGSLPITCVN